MKIFIIGSYFEKTRSAILANIRKAESIGIEIIKKGHLPLVPQTMFAFWENKLETELIMKTCFDWIKECDAVFVLNIGKKGGGTWSAMNTAKKHGKKIFRKLSDVPDN